MLCIQPIKLAGGDVGCGQCPSCRVNRRRDWTARLLLHHCGHVGQSAFCTLTYREVPRGSKGEAVLCPGDVRWFVQRLRRAVGELRYCLVGEYGERTGRPHYHALLWSGRSPDLGLAVRTAWDKGFVDVGEISEASIVYTVSYVLKGDRNVSWARFSEGLGAAALPELRRCARADSDGQLQLPREFRLRGQVWPLPKYLRDKLRAEGYGFERRTDEVLEESFVQALRGASGKAAADAILAYRVQRREKVAVRRARSRARWKSNFVRRRHETL